MSKNAKERQNATTQMVYKAPKTTQKTIPIEEVYADGMMKHGSVYSVAFSVADTNYTATSDENQADILLGYEEIIKSIASDVEMKVVLMNRIEKDDHMRDKITIPLRGDDKDPLRIELNEINYQRATAGDNNISRERFLVLSSAHQSKEHAATWFRRLRENLFRDINSLGTTAHQLDADERLETLSHFFRPHVDYEDHKITNIADKEGNRKKRELKKKRSKAGKLDFSDRIAPDSIEFPADGSYFKIDGRFGRVLMVRDFPTNMDDTLFSDLLDMPREMIVTADYVAMDKDEALRIINRHKDTVEGDIRKRTMSAGKEGNWNASIPRHLEEERETCNYMFDILNKEDQRLIMGQVVIVHMAETKEQLDLDTVTIQSTGKGKGIDIGILRHRQERGLNTALPYGLECVNQRRIISSENASFLIPFRTKEIFEPNGIVYGMNEISKNLIMMNRMNYKNGNGFIVGDAGGGKSVLAKSEMYAVYLTTDDDMIILDPDGEYSRVVEWLGGQVIHISAESPDHINMMDISRDFDAGDDAITLKCGVISGAADLMMRGEMTGAQRSVTDRCVYRVLSKYQASQGTLPPPTLLTLYDELVAQEEDAAYDVALAMELFTKGSLNTFAQPTNVNINNRVICFDIKDLSSQMRELGMMVVLDEIDRRVARNRIVGKHTWIWCDEIWTLLNFPQTEEYLWGFWKRCRKYGGLPTGITQSLSAVKDSEKGREMMSNSEFVFMMGMSANDREGAADLFNLSVDQQGFLTRATPGHGLMRAGKVIIPLDATISKDTNLYRVATTNLDEVASLTEEEQAAEQQAKTA